MTERWRKVLGGNYSVSDAGRLRRETSRRGWTAGSIIDPRPATSGYRATTLMGLSVCIHTLVALAFIGPRPPRHEVNHRNGIKTDDRLANLEYVTHSKNMVHAVLVGLLPTRLSPAVVRTIRRERAEGASCAELARRLGLHRTTVSKAVLGRNWSHV